MRNSPERESKSSIPYSMAIPALAALLIGGGAIVYTMQSPPVANTDRDEKRPSRVSRAEEDVQITEPTSRIKKFIPPPESRPNVHSMRRVEENGISLVLIRLVEGGDELVMDPTTGKLIQTRPAAGKPIEAKNFFPPMRWQGLRDALTPTGCNTNSINPNCLLP